MEAAEENAAKLAPRVASLAEDGERMGPDARFDRELAVGTLLHHCYSAMEAALERLVLTVDGSLPTGSDYHSELIRRAAADIPGLRPAIVSAGLASDLQELRRFRHAFRNVYVGYDHAKAVGNVPTAIRAVGALKAEIMTFARVLGSEADL